MLSTISRKLKVERESREIRSTRDAAEVGRITNNSGEIIESREEEEERGKENKGAVGALKVPSHRPEEPPAASIDRQSPPRLEDDNPLTEGRVHREAGVRRVRELRW